MARTDCHAPRSAAWLGARVLRTDVGMPQLFLRNTSYRSWWAGFDREGCAVRFCWSCHRDSGGYFIGWRQKSVPAELNNGTFILISEGFFGLRYRRQMRDFQLGQAVRFAAARGDDERVAWLVDPSSQPTETRARGWFVPAR